jgi:hypothetical protein
MDEIRFEPDEELMMVPIHNVTGIKTYRVITLTII